MPPLAMQASALHFPNAAAGWAPRSARSVPVQVTIKSHSSQGALGRVQAPAEAYEIETLARRLNVALQRCQALLPPGADVRSMAPGRQRDDCLQTLLEAEQDFERMDRLWGNLQEELEDARELLGAAGGTLPRRGRPPSGLGAALRHSSGQSRVGRSTPSDSARCSTPRSGVMLDSGFGASEYSGRSAQPQSTRGGSVPVACRSSWRQCRTGSSTPSTAFMPATGTGHAKDVYRTDPKNARWTEPEPGPGVCAEVATARAPSRGAVVPDVLLTPRGAAGLSAEFMRTPQRPRHTQGETPHHPSPQVSQAASPSKQASVAAASHRLGSDASSDGGGSVVASILAAAARSGPEGGSTFAILAAAEGVAADSAISRDAWTAATPHLRPQCMTKASDCGTSGTESTTDLVLPTVPSSLEPFGADAWAGDPTPEEEDHCSALEQHLLRMSERRDVFK